MKPITPLKKIIYVWNYLEWGGVQIYFLGLMRSAADNFEVQVVLPKGSDKKIIHYLEDNDIKYEYFEGNIDISEARTISRKIKRRINNIKSNVSLAKHLSRLDLSDAVVQIDVAPWAGFTLLFYLILKTNVFVTFHTALPQISAWRRMLWKIKFFGLTAFKRFHLAASNNDVKKSLRPFVNESCYQKIEVVYSSINIIEIEEALASDKTRREIAEKYNFPLEKKWICNVAQFIERKGCWIFLETIEMFQKQRDDLFFFWLGTAPLQTETLRRIKKYNVGDNFRFLSADQIGKSRSDLLTLWKSADLFVLPSFEEGLPVALIEAMALGKACIASQVNAIPEVIKYNETGVLIAPGDASELHRAINNLADNTTLRQELGQNARKLVLENFEEKTIGRKMIRLYESVN